MSDGLIIGIVVCGMIAFFGGIVWGVASFANWQADISCHARWPEKYAPNYGWNPGCTILVNGERIPAANYRVL